MPQVPVSGGPRVQLGGLPGVSAQTPNGATPDVRLNAPTLNTSLLRTPQLDAAQIRPGLKDPGAIRRVELSTAKGDQASMAGRNLGVVSANLDKAVNAYTTKVNATVTDGALNAAREAARALTYGTPDGKGGLQGGYKNVKGWDAINRADGKPLDDEVGEAFDTQVKEIAKSKLTNADQRFAFERQVGDLAAQLRQGVGVHAAQQFDTYYTGVYTGMTQNLQQDFGNVDPGDRKGQHELMDKLEGAVSTLASHRGDSEQELEVGLRAARGAAVASLFDKVIGEKKYDTAQALLNEWGDKIDVNAAAKMKSGLDGRVHTALGEQLAESAWRNGAAPSYETTTPDRTFNVMINLESRGRQVGDDGKVVRSPVGAFGVAQLMPDTAEEVAKKLGRPELAELAKQPTKEGQAANMVLGRTYFNQLVTQFNGDTEKAMAAYNAGPGALVGGKDRRGNPIEGALKIAARTGTDWRTHLPLETQNYIRNGKQQVGAGKGVPSKPSLQALYDAVDARTDDPDVRKAAYAWIDKRKTAADYDERNSQESALAAAITIVRENGGDINRVAPELRDKIKPSDWANSVQPYAKNVAEGQYIVTKPEAYYTAMNPEVLRTMTPAQLEAMRPDLSEQAFKTVSKAREDAQKPQPGKGPESLDFGLVDRLVNDRLRYMGIDPQPGKGDVRGTQRAGTIRMVAHDYVLGMQRQSGVKVTDYGEMEKLVNGMFMRDQKFKRATLFGEKDDSINVMTAEVYDIPSSTRKTLEAGFKTAKGRKPTDAEVQDMYLRSQLFKR